MKPSSRALFLLAALLLGGQSFFAGAQDWGKVQQAARASLMELRVSGTNEANNYTGPDRGTGFVVHTDELLKLTFILTAAHVVGEDAEWLTVDGTVKRQVQVRRQADNGVLVDVAADAKVLKVYKADDVAVLAIPQEQIPALKLRPVTGLTAPNPLLLIGFPAVGGRYVPRDLPIRELDEAKNRIYLQGVVDRGQSGSPVMDGLGRVVAIASQNNDKQSPTFHHSVSVSAALKQLNDYLDEHGRPRVALEDFASSKFAIVARTGQMKLAIGGSGDGDLGKGQSVVHGIDAAKEATLQAQGGEASECDAEWGRVRSEATANVELGLYENNGVLMRANLLAQGGHYKRAVACLGGSAVGIKGHDTSAVAAIQGRMEIELDVGEYFDLRVSWRNMPAGSRIEIIDPTSAARSAETVKSDDAHVLKVDRPGKWRVRSIIDTAVKSPGPAEQARLDRQALLFVHGL